MWHCVYKRGRGRTRRVYSTIYFWGGFYFPLSVNFMSLNKDFLIKLPVNAEIKLKLEGNHNNASCVMAPARCLTGGGEKK